MKTTTIHSLPVSPDLRDTAQNVLHEGKSLSAFVEFGLSAGAEAKRTGEYYSSDDVINDLKGMLAAAK